MNGMHDLEAKIKARIERGIESEAREAREARDARDARVDGRTNDMYSSSMSSGNTLPLLPEELMSDGRAAIFGGDFDHMYTAHKGDAGVHVGMSTPHIVRPESPTKPRMPFKDDGRARWVEEERPQPIANMTQKVLPDVGEALSHHANVAQCYSKGSRVAPSWAAEISFVASVEEAVEDNQACEYGSHRGASHSILTHSDGSLYPLSHAHTFHHSSHLHPQPLPLDDVSDPYPIPHSRIPPQYAIETIDVSDARRHYEKASFEASINAALSKSRLHFRY